MGCTARQGSSSVEMTHFSHPEVSSRVRAALTLNQVIHEGQVVDQVWQDWPPGRDTTFAREIVYGSLRYLPRLHLLLSELTSERPVPLLESLCISALYQLLYLRVPTHATVHENVAAAKTLGLARAAPMVNAILRRTMREQQSLMQLLEGSEVGRFAYPQWWINEVKTDWPHTWEALLLAGNRRAPMTLRVNLQRTTRNAYQDELARAGFPAQTGSLSTTAIRLERPCPVDRLPGFARGWVSVQDEAAQLATPFLDPEPGMHVLDACSAPGGKTAHLLEYTRGDIHLDVVDRDPERLDKVRSTIQRIGCGIARLIPADATHPDDYFTGEPYDRILLDAPCSGSGVVRRHPDIKVTRNRSGIELAQALQTRLLEATWPLLRGSGRLLYVTCSIFERENDQVIGAFLAAHPEATCERFPDHPLQETRFGVICLTGQAGCDGFYFARLRKSG